MADPKIISAYEGGRHNADLSRAISRLDKAASHKDLSVVIVIPTYKPVPPRIVLNWMSLINPPNNRVARLMADGAEVGEAYTRTIEAVLAHPELSKWKYLLTLEHDNAPPSDGLVKLLAEMEAHQEYAAIGGLYWTKGEGGVAQIWGDPSSHPFNFRPQKPDPNGGMKECNGTGMGFTLYRLAMFKDPKLRKPWFKTLASREHGVGTQDLYFWGDARAKGYRCAIDCSVKVGHWDAENEVMW